MEYNWFFINFVEIQINSLCQFFFGIDTDLSEHLFGHLAKESFDHVEPGTVLGSKHKLKSS